MPVQTEGKYLGDWLKFEAENHYSRDLVTILAGNGADRALSTGMVLGKITKGAAAGAAVAGNTGRRHHHRRPTVGQAAKPGVYRLVCIEPAADGGKFAVRRSGWSSHRRRRRGRGVHHASDVHHRRRRGRFCRW